MIRAINLYPATIINHFYTYNTINHQNTQLTHHKNMASVIGLDGVERVQYTIIPDPQYHKYQE